MRRYLYLQFLISGIGFTLFSSMAIAGPYGFIQSTFLKTEQKALTSVIPVSSSSTKDSDAVTLLPNYKIDPHLVHKALPLDKSDYSLEGKVSEIDIMIGVHACSGILSAANDENVLLGVSTFEEHLQNRNQVFCNLLIQSYLSQTSLKVATEKVSSTSPAATSVKEVEAIEFSDNQEAEAGNYALEDCAEGIGCTLSGKVVGFSVMEDPVVNKKLCYLTLEKEEGGKAKRISSYVPYQDDGSSSEYNNRSSAQVCNLAADAKFFQKNVTAIGGMERVAGSPPALRIYALTVKN